MRSENALLSRVIASSDGDKVVIHEEWDTKHPDCPFVWWKPVDCGTSIYFNRIEMTPKQFDEMKPPLKERN